MARFQLQGSESGRGTKGRPLFQNGTGMRENGVMGKWVMWLKCRWVSELQIILCLCDLSIEWGIKKAALAGRLWISLLKRPYKQEISNSLRTVARSLRSKIDGGRSEEHTSELQSLRHL